MKKTAGKIILFVLCLALVVFLLLPFLQSTAAKPADGMTAQTATPQIFTSNPLTELVNRIARFFSGRKKQPAPQTLTARQADEQFGTPVDEQELYADARAAVNAISTEAAPQSGGTSTTSFGDATLQTEEGEWVLIRQTAPEESMRGMHEINTQDNPYDIYVRQERAARFNPAVQTAAAPAVPDSKWARLMNPIKRFFGFSAPQQVASAPVAGNGEEGFQLASSEKMGSNAGKTVSSSRRGGGVDIPEIGASLPEQTPQKADSQSNPLLSYLDPDAMLNEAADSLADAKYPNPQTPQDKKEKEAYRQQRMAEAREYFLSRSQERLNRLAGGQEPQDELKKMLEYSCANKAPRPVKSSVCLEDNPNTRPASKQQIDEMKAQNAQVFFQKTNLMMPPAPITPVIGRATGLPKEDLDESILSPEYIKTVEIYEFMMQNEDCASQPCYWVANANQSTTELSDSVEAAGAVLKGDPLDKYSQVEKDFAQYKLEQLPASASEQEKADAQSQAEQFAPAYILYTTDDLKSIQEQNRQAIRERSMKDGAALYALTAPIGKQLSQDLDSTVFFYGTDDSFINADTNDTFAKRSQVLTNTLADQIQFFQQVAQEIRRNTSQEIVQEQTRREAEEIQKRFQKDRSVYDKNHSGGGK